MRVGSSVGVVLVRVCVCADFTCHLQLRCYNFLLDANTVQLEELPTVIENCTDSTQTMLETLQTIMDLQQKLAAMQNKQVEGSGMVLC